MQGEYYKSMKIIWVRHAGLPGHGPGYAVPRVGQHSMTRVWDKLGRAGAGWLGLQARTILHR